MLMLTPSFGAMSASVEFGKKPKREPGHVPKSMVRVAKDKANREIERQGGSDSADSFLLDTRDQEP